MNDERAGDPRNWFVALPVRSAPGLEERMGDLPKGLRRFVPADWHLTVAFLGAVGEARARAGWEAMRWPEVPARASLDEMVPMGPPRHWSALSALLAEGREVIEGAMTDARDAVFDGAGIGRDSRPAKAHLTVARAKRQASASERATALAWARGVDVRELVIELDRPALYTWCDDRSERLFQIVTRLA